MSTTNTNESAAAASSSGVTQKAKKAAGWVTGLLTGWGIPGTIARIIAGAIVGAIATAAAFTGTGCTASYKQTAAGDVDYSHSLTLPLPVETSSDK